jgi:hypothetical protein
VLGAALVCAALVAATGPPAAFSAASPSEPTWGPIRVLGAGSSFAVTVDATGHTTVVWSGEEGIRATRRGPNGHWSTSEVISRGTANWDPEVGVDGRGSVTAIWKSSWKSSREGFTTGVSTARRPAGRGWSTPVHLTVDKPLTHPSDDPPGVEDLSVAVSPGGAVLATWAWGRYQHEPAYRVQAAYRPAGGHWSKVVNVTPANGSAYPVAGLDARGNAVLVYSSPTALRCRRLVAGGTWTKAITLARNVGWPHAVAVDRQGNAIVMFTSYQRQRLWTRYSRAGSGWGAARALSPKGVHVDQFDLAMNARGAARVVYSDGWRYGALRSRPPQGPWGPPVRMRVDGSVVALNRSGDTFVAWCWGPGSFYGRYRPHAGPWGTAQLLYVGESVNEWAAAVAPDGDVVVMWEPEESEVNMRVMQAG